jgi:autotransporter-associated beta strand protein
MGAANDTVALFTASTITGALNGGGGTNTLILNSVPNVVPVGTIDGALTNFQILTKLAGGEWIITGPITTSGGVTATVQQGTLTLTGANTNFTGSMTVFPGAVLQIGRGGTSGSFAAPITDNGIVAFNRSCTLTNSNVISGSGQVGQIGTGTLILAGANTYTGGTFINSGTLNVSSDGSSVANPLGALSGPLTFNAPAPINTIPNPTSPPTFQFGANFDLTSTRAITINPPGGTFRHARLHLDHRARHDRRWRDDQGRQWRPHTDRRQRLHWRHDDQRRDVAARQRHHQRLDPR